MSATPAWAALLSLALGKVALSSRWEHFEKVQRVREQSPHVSVTAIAIPLINIACNYRRMGSLVGRPRPCYSGNRPSGRTKEVRNWRQLMEREARPFLDQGQDSEAVEWLSRAYKHHQTLPSPNLDTIAEDLTHEITALQRLGAERTNSRTLKQGWPRCIPP